MANCIRYAGIVAKAEKIKNPKLKEEFYQQAAARLAAQGAKQ